MLLVQFQRDLRHGNTLQNVGFNSPTNRVKRIAAKDVVRPALALTVAPIFGIIALVAAFLLQNDDGRQGFGQTVTAAWEKASAVSFVFLFVAGVFSGLIAKGPLAPFIGAACLAIYPILAVTDMMRDPTSHNLWPFEFAIYAIFSVVPLAGSLAANYRR